MSDPAWLPSAIMQTVGALYGIFIAVFVLALPSLHKHILENKEGLEGDDETKFDNTISFFKILFIILGVLVIFVELYNGMILYFISDDIFGHFQYLLLFSYFTLAATILYIVGFSYAVVVFLISLIEKKPIYHSGAFLDRFFKYNFVDIAIALTVFFILLTVFVYSHYKLNNHIVASIIIVLLLVSVSYYAHKKAEKSSDCEKQKHGD
ncbi:magnesium-transporting ATPase (P-type) [Methanohalophilus levihalophilus]|uniref:hypothetical protein n=1 Tax=Methanohalophilus levihalophilus TaxID=1431282 RepID=UPI001AEAE886|nr:hypothetical protein [Methanohalophilus levihalophilus]MBP2031065.1 magnesium-transporting ATPase (P-type) [Methanohalophilus levihalophilus]